VIDCPFCGIAAGQLPAVLLFEDDETLAFLDIRPAAEGHSLIIPRTHSTNILDTPESVVRACMATTQRIARAIQRALSPDGMRINQFNGGAAGQTVFHFHLHVVPVGSSGPSRSHGRDLADPQRLERVAERIRQNL
jgi:histidine triad (HIT) family protein